MKYHQKATLFGLAVPFFALILATSGCRKSASSDDDSDSDCIQSFLALAETCLPSVIASGEQPVTNTGAGGAGKVVDDVKIKEDDTNTDSDDGSTTGSGDDGGTPTVDSAVVTDIVLPSAAHYVPGDVLTFNVTFDKAVEVSGTPRLTLTVGAAAVYASYQPAPSSATLNFSYTVGLSDYDLDGLALATAIDLNGGSIASDGTPVGLALEAVDLSTISVGSRNHNIDFSETDFLAFADTPDLAFGGALAVSAWVKGGRQTTGVIVGQWDANLMGTNSSWILSSGYSDDRMLIAAVSADGTTTNAKVLQSKSVVFDGSWHHIGMVFSGGSLKMYIDGVREVSPTAIVDSAVATLNHATGPLSIGSAGGASGYFHGSIDDVALFTSGLSDAEMTTLYNGGTPLLINRNALSSSLFSWWRLGDRPDDDITADTGLMHDDGPAAHHLIPNHTDGTEIVTDAP